MTIFFYILIVLLGLFTAVGLTYLFARIWTKGKLDQTEHFAKTHKWSNRR